MRDAAAPCCAIRRLYEYVLTAQVFTWMLFLFFPTLSSPAENMIYVNGLEKNKLLCVQKYAELLDGCFIKIGFALQLSRGAIHYLKPRTAHTEFRK